MTWQPIETAPKDRCIDLWSARGFRYAHATWDVTEYGTSLVVDDCVYGWTDPNHHGSIEEGGPYTHWMDEPEPPQ